MLLLLLSLISADGISLDQSGERLACVRISDWHGAYKASACSKGSGCYVGDGLVVTAAHVVQRGAVTTVQVGGKELGARLLGMDTTLDVALLLTYPATAPVLPLDSLADAVGRYTDPKPVLDGHAWGLAPGTFWSRTVSLQHSGVMNEVRAFASNRTVACSGDSGGPIVQQGKVVGVLFGTVESDGKQWTAATPGWRVRKWIEERHANVKGRLK